MLECVQQYYIGQNLSELFERGGGIPATCILGKCLFKQIQIQFTLFWIFVNEKSDQDILDTTIQTIDYELHVCWLDGTKN